GRYLQSFGEASDLQRGPTSRRAHIILLRAQGLTWQQVKTVLFCSFDLISATLTLFRKGRVAAVLEQQIPQRSMPAWMLTVLRWVSEHTPRDFRYFRSRWSCETLAHLLAFETGLRLAEELFY